MRNFVIGAVLFLTGMNWGCVLAPPPGGGGSGLRDTDNDGFRELLPPEGVDTSQSIAVQLINEISREELESAFSLDAIPVANVALDAIEVTTTFDVTLGYANGGESSFREERELGEFEIAVEAACPESITAVVSVLAQVRLPIVGTLPLFSETLDPFVLSQDAGPGGPGFECDRVVRFRSSFNEATGQPDVEFTIEDFE